MRAFSCTVGLLLLTLACPVQAGQTSQMIAQAGSDTYLLAADDALSITVVNFPNLSTAVVVPPDGKITVQLLKPFSVVGKTTAEVAQALTEQWNKYVVEPSVTVSLTQKRRDKLLVYGFVNKIGTVEYRAPMHILEAVAEVGGAAPNGDLAHVSLTRRGGDKQVLDLSHPENKGGSEADVLLLADDVIYVPERRTQISITGEVGRPGSMDYKEDMTVLDALGEAGGIRETSDLPNATLMHDGKERSLDLDALLRHGDMSLNTKLSPGDRIQVPELHNRTYVFGAVGRPGYYLFKPGDRILDALNGSGGPSPNANLAKINVIRVDKTKNTAKVEVADIDRFLKKADLKANIPLSPGDVLFVPDKKRPFSLQDVFGALSGINVFSGAFRLLGLTGR